MNWKKLKVLVTGGGGFIGSHLVEELAKRGATVTAMLKYSSRSDWGNLEFLPSNLKKKMSDNKKTYERNRRDPLQSRRFLYQGEGI